MAVNLEFEPVKSHFASCKLSPHSRCRFRSYEWSFIMSNEDFWYRMAERAFVRHDLERCAAICFQWLFSFTEAFDDDAFHYSDDRFVFRSVIEWFSDLILKVYDDHEASDELRLAIIKKYDQLNHMEKLDNYMLFDINDIIETRLWPIDVIDFKAIYQARQEAKEGAKLKAKALALEQKRRKFLEEHFACDYQEPSERFKAERIQYPIFKRDSPNLPKRIMPKLRKIYERELKFGTIESLMQNLDGHIRAAHIQAVKGELGIATLINDATVGFINEISQEQRFLSWIGEDKEAFAELDKILSNASKLNEYCASPQKTAEDPQSVD